MIPPGPLLIVLAIAFQASAREPFEAKVVGISDGDTITVLRGKQSIKIRLHGIDSPETGQPFGTKAKQRTSDLAFGKMVKILPKDTDRYGRTVAEVVLADSASLNRELVRDGLAWHYEKYAPADATLRDLQAEAKSAKRGLWTDAEQVAPWDWRDGKGRGVELPAGSVIGNRNSHLYHSPTCKGGAKIAEKNRMVFESAAKAEAVGYRRAGDCR